MEVDAEARGVECRRALGQQRPDQPGKHVAAPGRRENGVGEGCHRDSSVGSGDDRARALEDDHLGEPSRRLAGTLTPQVVVSRDYAPGQPLELARMRGQHQLPLGGDPPLSAAASRLRAPPSTTVAARSGDEAHDEVAIAVRLGYA